MLLVGGFENGRKLRRRRISGELWRWRLELDKGAAKQSTAGPPRPRHFIGKFLVLAETGGHVTNGDLPLSAVIRNKYSGGGSQVGLLHSWRLLWALVTVWECLGTIQASTKASSPTSIRRDLRSGCHFV